MFKERCTRTTTRVYVVYMLVYCKYKITKTLDMMDILEPGNVPSPTFMPTFASWMHVLGLHLYFLHISASQTSLFFFFCRSPFFYTSENKHGFKCTQFLISTSNIVFSNF